MVQSMVELAKDLTIAVILIIRVDGVRSLSLLAELLNARKGHQATSITPAHDVASR
jgi:hypothetical protein